MQKIVWHESICVFDCLRNLGHNPLLYLFRESPVDLFATDDVEVASEVRLEREHSLLIPHHDNGFETFYFSPSAQDYVEAVRQRFPEREPRAMAHDAGVRDGLLLKEFQIGGVVPGDGTIAADGSISIHSDDADDCHD